MKNSKTLNSAQKAEIPVVSDKFFDDINSCTSKKEFVQKINENKISSWNFDVNYL